MSACNYSVQRVISMLTELFSFYRFIFFPKFFGEMI